MEKKEPKIKILVACHKADPAIRQDDIYMPIHVGKALHPELDLGFQGDDTGDNISEKNGSYCELTAMYWAWKNLPKDVDIVGLCHYRRYFALDKKDPKGHIQKLLNRKDLIALPFQPREFSNIDRLAQLTCIEDVTLFVELLIESFPQWKSIIGKYFYKSNYASVCNMMIMPRNLFNEYCAFMFPFLEKLEMTLLATEYSRIQRRIGYFAELLLGFWIHATNRSYTPLFYDSYDEGLLKRLMRDLRRNLIFSMFKHPPFKVYYAVKVGLEQDGKPLKYIT